MYNAREYAGGKDGLLGGKVNGFTFKLPGPDHHARWMAKVIYNLKIKLLSNIFGKTDEKS